jgi:hypothetical protein
VASLCLATVSPSLFGHLGPARRVQLTGTFCSGLHYYSPPTQLPVRLRAEPTFSGPTSRTPRCTSFTREMSPLSSYFLGQRLSCSQNILRKEQSAARICLVHHGPRRQVSLYGTRVWLGMSVRADSVLPSFESSVLPAAFNLSSLLLLRFTKCPLYSQCHPLFWTSTLSSSFACSRHVAHVCLPIILFSFPCSFFFFFSHSLA